MQLVFGKRGSLTGTFSHKTTDFIGAIQAAVRWLVHCGPETLRPKHRLASLFSLFLLSVSCLKTLLQVHLGACETVLAGKHILRLISRKGAIVHDL